MVFNFFNDLNKARVAEGIVKDTFTALTDKYTFENVANDRQYFYKGDIKATAADGREIFIEVKDDSRIGDTHNVLCEYEVYYKNNGTFGKGNMKSDYDIYCVVSQTEQKIYVIDFPTLQQNYTKGNHKIIYHYDQDTYCYLLPLAVIKQLGGLIAVIDY